MNPRGVTLVELLAAISILVVVTALALPSLQNRLSAARLEAAQGQLQAAALATRADAMRQGRSLSLTARAMPSGEVDLMVAPLNKTEPARATGSSSDAADRESVAGSKWATLPGPIKFSPQPPAPPDPSERAPKNAGAESRDVRLAVFCPDGSAVTSPSYLCDGDTVFVVTVNPWIGGVKFAAFIAETRDAPSNIDGKSSEPVNPGDISKPAVPSVKGGAR